MTQYTKIDEAKSVLLRALHQDWGISCRELAKRYPEHAVRSIFRHATSKKENATDKRKMNTGRPKKLDGRDEEKIVMTVQELEREQGYMPVEKIREVTGLTHVSIRTVHRILKRNGYRYRYVQKKAKEKTKTKTKKDRRSMIWTNEVKSKNKKPKKTSIENKSACTYPKDRLRTRSKRSMKQE